MVTDWNPAAAELYGYTAGAQQVQAITDLLAAQAERDRSASQLAEARRLDTLGTLAGGIAHEVNNTLGAILGYTELVIQQLAAQDWPDSGPGLSEARRDLEEVRSAVDRAAHVTGRLLAFARRAMISPQRVDLNDIVAVALPPLAAALGEHLTLATHLAEDLWPVTADPDQMRAVLLELADNARQAMAANGTLVIDTTNVTLDEDAAPRAGLQPGPYARLRVTDTGTGMPSEVTRRAFEPFYTTKPMGGLGLAAVHGIVAQAGGHTEIYSTPDTGTTVTVLLPASAGGPEAERQPSN